MSTCISRHGEYGSHEPPSFDDDPYCCHRCGVFDEERVLQLLGDAEAEIEQLCAAFSRVEALLNGPEYIEADQIRDAIDGPVEPDPPTPEQVRHHLGQEDLIKIMHTAIDGGECPYDVSVRCDGHVRALRVLEQARSAGWEFVHAESLQAIRRERDALEAALMRVDALLDEKGRVLIKPSEVRRALDGDLEADLAPECGCAPGYCHPDEHGSPELTGQPVTEASAS